MKFNSAINPVMPSICSVFGCSENSRRDNPVKFYSFPKSEYLSNIWVHKCARKDQINVKYARICSKHFGENQLKESLKYRITGIACPSNHRGLKQEAIPDALLPTQKSCIPGKPAGLHDINSPDYVPSQKLGYTPTHVPDVERHLRYLKRSAVLYQQDDKDETGTNQQETHYQEGLEDSFATGIYSTPTLPDLVNSNQISASCGTCGVDKTDVQSLLKRLQLLAPVGTRYYLTCLRDSELTFENVVTDHAQPDYKPGPASRKKRGFVLEIDKDYDAGASGSGLQLKSEEAKDTTEQRLDASAIISPSLQDSVDVKPFVLQGIAASDNVHINLPPDYEDKDTEEDIIKEEPMDCDVISWPTDITVELEPTIEIATSSDIIDTKES